MIDTTGRHATQIADSSKLVALSPGEVFGVLRKHAKTLAAAPLAAGLVAVGVVMLIPPTFTATTAFLPPQQQQSAASSALASLGSLATLAGGSASLRTPGDQYVTLLQSVSVADRIIERFRLLQVYERELRVDARAELSRNVRISLGKKDGIITVEVDDSSPERAANIANAYVQELHSLTANLAVTEAQQRRVFFERQLQQSRDRLAQAQQALQASGYNPSALKAEPKAAAEAYGRLRTEAIASEIRLEALKGSLTDAAPEVRQQEAILAGLRRQLALAEQAVGPSNGPDYVSKYREFKYQEALFDLYARQFELARVDESREGMLIQVIDPAKPPEKKSKPRRGLIVLSTVLGMFAATTLFVLMRHTNSRRHFEAGEFASVDRQRT